MVLSISNSRLHLENNNDIGVLSVLVVILEEVQLTGLDTTIDRGRGCSAPASHIAAGGHTEEGLLRHADQGGHPRHAEEGFLHHTNQ
jgi:hypothetical protein